VLGRWLGLTPEQPALCLRGFPGRLRVALSRVSDPPGLDRRQGAHRAARGTIREKRYNLPHPPACTPHPMHVIIGIEMYTEIIGKQDSLMDHVQSAHYFCVRFICVRRHIQTV
jgi:hypothetical protein